MRALFCVAILLVLSACASDGDEFSSRPITANRYTSLPLEERQKLAPNQLFAAVLNGQMAQATQILHNDPALLNSVNGYGDTPLGAALKFNEGEMGSWLSTLVGKEDLSHRNLAGESYVYLAAKAGQSDVIRRLSDRLYNSLHSMNTFAFSRLDQPTESGQTALFVAANREVAETLEAEYYRGLLEFPSWTFRLHTDQKSQTFLHQAALDGRADVVLWASEHICRPGSWESSERFWLSWPSWLLEGALRSFQTYIADPGVPVGLIFNRQNDEYKTALHIALETKNWRVVRALSGCRWLDHELADSHGHLPLQSFLTGINPLRLETDKDTREIFTFLMNQQTTLRRPIWSLANRVNHQDSEGETALHAAARLADPYYFEQLKNFGDINVRNKLGQSPLQLRTKKSGLVSNAR